jgi:hypothetical protein
MDGDLSIQGTLAETTVPDLFRSVIRNGETAIVSFEAIGRHDNVYFHEGRIVFATSSDPDLGLAEVLLRGGELNLQQYDDAVDRAVGVNRMGSVLCERGYLAPDELTRAVERQVSTIVKRALAFRTGSYTIEFVSEFPKDILHLQLNTERLLLDGIHAIEHWSLIARGIGRLDRVLCHGADADRRMFHLDLTEEETHVYSLLGEGQTVSALCERSYLSNFATCRTAWALLAVNFLDDAQAGVADGQRADVVMEMELEALVERYNTAYQAIFGIVFQRIGDYVYDFLDRIVRHLSPEVMPYLSGVNLINESRVDFDQLLNNLIASGSEDRPGIITNVLNELLYGWVYEIKSEFSGELDPQINPILEGLRK